VYNCGLLNVKIHIFDPVIEKSQTTCKTNVKNQEHQETVLLKCYLTTSIKICNECANVNLYK